jgi:hypothetical protein
MLSVGRRRGLEFDAVLLLLFSAMLDPLLTFGLAAALIAAGLVLVYLEDDDRGRNR